MLLLLGNMHRVLHNCFLGTMLTLGSSITMCLTGFSFAGIGTLLSLGTTHSLGESVGELGVRAFTKAKAEVHASRRNKRINAIESAITRIDPDASPKNTKYSAQNMFANNLANSLKKSGDIDGADVNALFRGDQTNNKEDPPVTIQFPEVKDPSKQFATELSLYRNWYNNKLALKIFYDLYPEGYKGMEGMDPHLQIHQFATDMG
ncbi:MAG: hypothetical protein BAJALOKI3v1_230001, partial [Promethearchaeota archaeon]